MQIGPTTRICVLADLLTITMGGDASSRSISGLSKSDRSFDPLTRFLVGFALLHVCVRRMTAAETKTVPS
jgi:hypothetical protein